MNGLKGALGTTKMGADALANPSLHFFPTRSSTWLGFGKMEEREEATWDCP